MMNLTCSPTLTTFPFPLDFAMPDDAPRERDGLLDSRLAGEFIRSRMQEKGLQIQQLADKIGMGNPSQLSNLLAGRQNIARSHYFRAIADALGLTAAEINHLNPNIVFVMDGDLLPPPLYRPEPTAELPDALKEAIAALQSLGYDLTEEGAVRMLPRGLDGRGPKTRQQWIDFLLAMRPFF